MKNLLLIVFLIWSGGLLAQDTLPPVPQDTATVAAPPTPRPPRRAVVPRVDSVVRDSFPYQKPVTLRTPLPGALTDTAYFNQPFLRFTDPVRYGVSIKRWVGKEAVFYAVIGLLLIFALIRNGFSRYVQDLFKIFFRTTVKQKQIRDQLVESPMPSLLLNIFFVLSAGFFMALVLHYYGLGTQYGLWELYLYCAGGLIAIYGLKFISLKLLGWVFQVKEAINSYVFIVFSTNKVLGMVLLPFIVVLSFSRGMMSEVAINLSLLVVAGLFAYRFFLSYASVHRQVRLSLFHFFLYLCAFELAPVLLINKLLFRLLGETS